MARLPYAAKQFLAEAEVEKYEAHDLDGLNVHRTLRFDKRTSKRLAPAMEYVDDERIAEWHVTDSGYLHITFAPGPEADERTEFLLADAITVAKGSKSS
jgi:hypothetical protein